MHTNSMLYKKLVKNFLNLLTNSQKYNIVYVEKV